jgi:alpha-L-fucosidase
LRRHGFLKNASNGLPKTSWENSGRGDSTQKNKDIQVYTAQDIRYTTSKSGSTLYATALGWPSGGSLTLHTLYSGNPYLAGPVCGVTLLGTGQSIAFEQRTDGLH